MIFTSGKNLMYFPRVKVCCHPGYCQDKSDIPHSVVKDGLKCGGVGVGSSVPSTNKEERYNADSLSPNKKLKYIVGGYEHNHGD